MTGPIVTPDALPTQTATARFLVEEKPAHDVMEVTGNPPTLPEACAALALEDCSPSGPHGRPGPRADCNPHGAHDNRPE